MILCIIVLRIITESLTVSVLFVKIINTDIGG